MHMYIYIYIHLQGESISICRYVMHAFASATCIIYFSHLYINIIIAPVHSSTPAHVHILIYSSYTFDQK